MAGFYLFMDVCGGVGKRWRVADNVPRRILLCLPASVHSQHRFFQRKPTEMPHDLYQQSETLCAQTRSCVLSKNIGNISFGNKMARTGFRT